MKREEICVLIDTPEKAKEAYEILKNESILFDLKTRLLNGIINNDYLYIGYSYKEWNGFVNSLDSNEITLNQLRELLKPKEKLVGVWFAIPVTGVVVKHLYGGDKNLYLNYLRPHLKTINFEHYYNSIPPRMGSELFGIFIKK